MDEISVLDTFFERLDKCDNSTRVLFKRAAGQSIKETDSRTLYAFFSLIPNSLTRQEEDNWFTAACIHCLWKAEQSGRRPFEQALASLSLQTDSESFQKRVVNLLDTRMEDDGFLTAKLVRMAKYLLQKDLPVDGRSLVADLKYWNHPDRFIQKKWIKAFYREDTGSSADFTEQLI